MGQVIAAPTRTFAINIDLARGIRVMDNSGVLQAADATGDDFGTMERRYESTGLGASGYASVVLKNAQGTVEMVASAAITQYAAVEKAASGKIATFAVGERIGIALTAATADNDIIEVLPDGWA